MNLHLRNLIQNGICGVVLIGVVGCDLGNWVGRERASRNETFVFDLAESNECSIRAFNGAIHCRVGDVDQIELEATFTARAATVEQAEADVKNITVAHAVENGTTRLTAEIPKGTNGSVSMEVTLPRTLKLRLQTSNGSIDAKGVENAVDAESSNGKIVLTNCEGDVKAKTTNGSLNVTGERMERLVALASNGSIAVKGGLAVGDHEIRTSNGSVMVDVVGLPLVVTATTSNGSLKLNGKKLQKDKPTTSGDNADSGAAESARLSIRTSNGSVNVTHKSVATSKSIE